MELIRITDPTRFWYCAACKKHGANYKVVLGFWQVLHFCQPCLDTLRETLRQVAP